MDTNKLFDLGVGLMTVAASSCLLGKTVNVQFESLVIGCVILDVKQAYGKTRYLIEPINGSGVQWIESVRIVT